MVRLLRASEATYALFSSTRRYFLNIVHSRAINIEHCSVSEGQKNATPHHRSRDHLVDDALTLITDLGRAVLRVASAPIKRIANASDVAGALTPFRHLSHLT